MKFWLGFILCSKLVFYLHSHFPSHTVVPWIPRTLDYIFCFGQGTCKCFQSLECYIWLCFPCKAVVFLYKSRTVSMSILWWFIWLQSTLSTRYCLTNHKTTTRVLFMLWTSGAGAPWRDAYPEIFCIHNSIISNQLVADHLLKGCSKNYSLILISILSDMKTAS